MYLAVFPQLSVKGLNKGILQVTSSFDKVVYLRVKVAYNKNSQNTTIVALAPRAAVNLDVGGNLFLNSTDIYDIYIEINFSQPVTIVQYVTDQSLTQASSTLVYPVQMVNSNNTINGSHLLLTTSPFRNDTRISLTVTSMADGTTEVTLVFNGVDKTRVVVLGDTPVSFSQVGNITTSLDSLYQSLNINMNTDLDGTYLYSTQNVKVLLGTSAETQEILLEDVGATYEILLEPVKYFRLFANDSLYVYEIYQRDTGNHQDVCVTTLLPSSLWRDEYQFVQVSDKFTATVYIIVDANMARDIVTNDINVTWNCQNITGTSYSGCYTVLPNAVTYLHLQLTNRQRPFGAYVVGSTFCHPLGVSDWMSNISFMPFQHELYLRYLQDKQVVHCDDALTTYSTDDTSELTSDAVTESAVVVNWKISTEESQSTYSSDGPSEPTSSTDRSNITDSVTATATVTATSDNIHVTNPEVVTTTTQSSDAQRLAIVTFLSVEHSSLSSHRRTRISAPDARTSARVFGGAGIIIVCLVIMVFIGNSIFGYYSSNVSQTLSLSGQYFTFVNLVLTWDDALVTVINNLLKQVEVMDNLLKQVKVMDNLLKQGKVMDNLLKREKVMDNLLKQVKVMDNLLKQEKVMDNLLKQVKVMDNLLKQVKVMDNLLKQVKVMDNLLKQVKVMDNLLKQVKVMDNLLKQVKVMDNLLKQEKVMDNLLKQKKVMDNLLKQEKVMDNLLKQVKVMDNLLKQVKVMDNLLKQVKVMDNLLKQVKVMDNLLKQVKVMDNLLKQVKVMDNLLKQEKVMDNLLKQVKVMDNLLKQSYCQTNFVDGTLAEPTTDADLREIIQFVTSIGFIQGVWIGANDIAQEGTFLWASNNSSMNRALWGSTGQPDNFLSSEDCVEIWQPINTTGSLNDYSCISPMQFLCQTAADSPNPRMYLAVFPQLSMKGLEKGILQVTSSFDKVVYLRLKVAYNKNSQNTTIVALAPRAAVNLNVGGNLFLNSTDIYDIYLEINASRPVTIVQYVTDQSLTQASSTLVYPVQMVNSNNTINGSHLLLTTSPFRNDTRISLTVTSMADGTTEVTLVFNGVDKTRVVVLGDAPVSFSQVGNITTSLDSLYQSLNINMNTDLDGTYLYSTQNVKVLLGTSATTLGPVSFDSSLDELLPLTHISHEYFIFSTTQERKTVVRCQAVYGWTLITWETQEILLEDVGATYEILLEPVKYFRLFANDSLYVYEIYQRDTGNHQDVCVTTLLPSSLWRDEYQFVQVSDKFTATVCIIVDANMARDIVTNDINVTWNCQNITGTLYSGCYTVLPNTVTYLHLQLTNRQRPFGAYVVGSSQGSTFCHPLGVSDWIWNISFMPFQHELYLRYLQDKQVVHCDDALTTYSTDDTSELTSDAVTESAVVVNWKISTEESQSTYSSDGPSEPTSSTDRSNITDSVTATATVTATSDNIHVTNPEVVTTTQSSEAQRLAIVTFLSVEHSSLSSHRRTRISAPDARTSARVFGGAGIIIVCLVIIVFIGPDLTYIVQFVLSNFKKIKK
ncbi:hypothetical protein Btru_063056 [Bulinus truncatus]|nr:hypothetical protein Btru_063056 [Bulinus truncatus]